MSCRSSFRVARVWGKATGLENRSQREDLEKRVMRNMGLEMQGLHLRPRSLRPNTEPQRGAGA